MAVNVVMNKGMCQVSVEGEMTIFAAQEIKAALEEPISKASDIEFDLSSITEIDGAGLQIMLMAKIDCMQRGTKLRFTGAPACWSRQVRVFTQYHAPKKYPAIT